MSKVGGDVELAKASSVFGFNGLRWEVSMPMCVVTGWLVSCLVLDDAGGDGMVMPSPRPPRLSKSWSKLEAYVLAGAVHASLLLGKLHGKLAARTREAKQPDHLGFKLASRAGEGAYILGRRVKQVASTE